MVSRSVSPHTRRALREALSGRNGWVLREIHDLFQAEEFRPVPLDRPFSGQRRELAAEYLNDVDWGSPDDQRRVLRIAERILDRMPNPENSELCRLLRRDGFIRDKEDGRLRPSVDAWLLDLPTEFLADDGAIRQELDRIGRAWRNDDAGQVISAAKSLTEATCKVILQQRGGPSKALSSSPTLPTLLDAALRSLDLHPQQVDNSTWDREILEASRRVLGGMITSVNGLASLRNRLGADHGRAHEVRLPDRWGHLAAGAASVVCRMLLETLQVREVAEDEPSE